MDIDTAIKFFVKWCLSSFTVVMLAVGYYGSGAAESDAQLRVANSCKLVRGDAEATVTITRGNKSQQYDC